MSEVSRIRDAVIEAVPLPAAFYQRDGAVVAPDLIGKVLAVRHGRHWLAARIVEVEAYLGSLDLASHAYRGETKRNRSMFAAGGTCYVYLSYGVHHCMNVVTGAVGTGQGCLVRAAEPLLGAEHMALRRGLSEPPPSTTASYRQLTNGPGKLTQALGIGPGDDGRRFDEPAFKLIVLGDNVAPAQITAGPRVGVTKAVDLPLRFGLKASPFLSRPFR